MARASARCSRSFRWSRACASGGFNVLITSGTMTSARLAERRCRRRRPPIRAARRAELSAALSRALAAQPRAACRVRPVAEPDHGVRRSRHPDDPGQRAAVGTVLRALAPRAADDRGAAQPLRPVPRPIGTGRGAPERARRAARQRDRQPEARRAGAAGRCAEARGHSLRRRQAPAGRGGFDHPGEEAVVLDVHRGCGKLPGLLTTSCRGIPNGGRAWSTSRRSPGFPP